MLDILEWLDQFVDITLAQSTFIKVMYELYLT